MAPTTRAMERRCSSSTATDSSSSSGDAKKEGHFTREPRGVASSSPEAEEGRGCTRASEEVGHSGAAPPGSVAAENEVAAKCGCCDRLMARIARLESTVAQLMLQSKPGLPDGSQDGDGFSPMPSVTGADDGAGARPKPTEMSKADHHPDGDGGDVGRDAQAERGEDETSLLPTKKARSESFGEVMCADTRPRTRDATTPSSAAVSEAQFKSMAPLQAIPEHDSQVRRPPSHPARCEGASGIPPRAACALAPHSTSPPPLVLHRSPIGVWNYAVVLDMPGVRGRQGWQASPKVRVEPQMALSRVSLKWLLAARDALVDVTPAAGGVTLPPASAATCPLTPFGAPPTSLEPNGLPDRSICHLQLELVGERAAAPPCDVRRTTASCRGLHSPSTEGPPTPPPSAGSRPSHHHPSSGVNAVQPRNRWPCAAASTTSTTTTSLTPPARTAAVPPSTRVVHVEAQLDRGLFDAVLILGHDFVERHAARLESLAPVRPTPSATPLDASWPSPPPSSSSFPAPVSSAATVGNPDESEQTKLVLCLDRLGAFGVGVHAESRRPPGASRSRRRRERAGGAGSGATMPTNHAAAAPPPTAGGPNFASPFGRPDGTGASPMSAASFADGGATQGGFTSSAPTPPPMRLPPPYPAPRGFAPTPSFQPMGANAEVVAPTTRTMMVRPLTGCAGNHAPRPSKRPRI